MVLMSSLASLTCYGAVDIVRVSYQTEAVQLTELTRQIAIEERFVRIIVATPSSKGTLGQSGTKGARQQNSSPCKEEKGGGIEGREWLALHPSIARTAREREVQ